MSNKHDVWLEYTNNDDGIWICCGPCGWRENLGFLVHPNNVIIASVTHTGILH